MESCHLRLEPARRGLLEWGCCQAHVLKAGLEGDPREGEGALVLAHFLCEAQKYWFICPLNLWLVLMRAFRSSSPRPVLLPLLTSYYPLPSVPRLSTSMSLPFHFLFLVSRTPAILPILSPPRTFHVLLVPHVTGTPY